jgi:hypothetical protein
VVTPLGADEFPVNQGGTTKKVTLAQVSAYAPALLAYAIKADANADTASATMVDADAAALVVTFTTPASGKVLVRLSGVVQVDSTGSAHVGQTQYWGLAEGATPVTGAGVRVCQSIVGSNAAQDYRSASVPFVITGLTPGDAHSYKWTFKTSNSWTQIAISADEPAVMEVWAL